MASRVTPPADEEEADEEEADEVGGVAVSVYGHFGRSWASLRLMATRSMEHIGEKCVDSGYETKKWWGICMIAEGKMSLSRIVVSL